METIKCIIQTRAGGKVERCHTIPHNGSYSTAAHQWGVAMLLRYLYPNDFAELVEHALTHDVAEAWLGDLPAPVRWVLGDVNNKIQDEEDKILRKYGLPTTKDLTGPQLFKIRVCDMLELYLWCREQAAMGNLFTLECESAVCSWFLSQNAADTLPEHAMKLVSFVSENIGNILPEHHKMLMKP